MNTIVYEETLTGRPHDTSVQIATSDNEMWMQFNVMPRTCRRGGWGQVRIVQYCSHML